MTGPTYGSLFSGIGGLELGVQAVLGGETLWHVEFDEAPSKVLAHHWPGVRNFGDIRTVDWSTVPPVDILTGGFPCQDVSLAGRRAGITEGTRSGLWSEFARAIDVLRPGLVVIENVRGLLSATADGAMEPDPWGVGDGATRPVVNALGVVLGDLASLGYDTVRCGLRAADAGAPHGRFRIFVLAYPAGQSWRIGYRDYVSARSGEDGRGPHAGRGASPDAEHVFGYGAGRAWHGRAKPANDRVASADAGGDEPQRRGGDGDVARSPGTGESSRDQREWDGNAVGDRGSTATDAECGGCDGRSCVAKRISLGRVDAAGAREDVLWGEYEPAIRRWEAVTGRSAPAPTLPDGKNAGHRLSARFVEWMQGFEPGFATAPEIGLTRNEQLKAFGNAVVQQQAALAVRTLVPLIPGRVTR